MSGQGPVRCFIGQVSRNNGKNPTFPLGMLVPAACGEHGETLLFECVVGFCDVKRLLLVFTLEVGGGVSVRTRLFGGGVAAPMMVIMMVVMTIAPTMVIKVVIMTIAPMV